jgi:hypothetical protein
MYGSPLTSMATRVTVPPANGHERVGEQRTHQRRSGRRADRDAE